MHCAHGRDRTGLINLLLALVGVAAEDIAADYALSASGLVPLFTLLGQQDQGPMIEEYLTRAGASVGEVIISTLASLDTARKVSPVSSGRFELDGQR